MTLSKREAVEKLAEALQSSQSFADIYDIFLTHFAESDDWKTPGKKINKPLLRKMLVRLASTKFSVGKDYDMLPYMIRKIRIILSCCK